MRYERLREQSIHYSQCSEHEGAGIFIRRGMFIWMKFLASHENKKATFDRSDGTKKIIPSNLNSTIVLLLANMVINNHLQGVYNG
jgi:hypothetical protein